MIIENSWIERNNRRKYRNEDNTFTEMKERITNGKVSLISREKW